MTMPDSLKIIGIKYLFQLHIHKNELRFMNGRGPSPKVYNSHVQTLRSPRGFLFQATFI